MKRDGVGWLYLSDQDAHVTAHAAPHVALCGAAARLHLTLKPSSVHQPSLPGHVSSPSEREAPSSRNDQRYCLYR